MSERNANLQDVWRLLSKVSKRLDGVDKRFDALERDLVAFKADLRADMAAGFGALKASIEARDFRLDEHGPPAAYAPFT